MFSELSKEEAEQKEVELIKYYNSTNNNFGYNIAIGGGVNRGYKLSNETKRKISKSHKGKKISEDTRNKMSKSRMGDKNSMFGKHHLEETKRKISESLKGNICSEETKMKMSKSHKDKGEKVLCVEKNIIYKTILEASVENKINMGNICSVCKGKLKTAGGYHWKYIN